MPVGVTCGLASILAIGCNAWAEPGTAPPPPSDPVAVGQTCVPRLLPVGPIEANRSCSTDLDCVLVTSVCSPCTVSEDRAVAVRRGSTSPFPPCRNDVVSAACATHWPGDPVCDQGTCRVAVGCPLDLRDPRRARVHDEVAPSAISACTRDDECRVAPRACCHCGALDASDARAIRVDAAACEGTRQCPDCVSEPNPGLTSACVVGRCRLLEW